MRRERQERRKKGRRKEGKWEGGGRIEKDVGGRSVGKGRESGECCLPNPYTLEPAQRPVPVLLTMPAGTGPMAAPLWVSFSLYHE